MIELAEIGVITDMFSSGAKSLLASHIESFCEFAKIVCVCDYLSQSNWKPDNGVDLRILTFSSRNIWDSDFGRLHL